METVVSSLTERKIVFTNLYESVFPAVARWISNKNGSFEDARDIFQEALIIYFEKTEDLAFQIKKEPEAYIMGIAKHLWVRKFNSNVRNMAFEELQEGINISEDHFPSLNLQKLYTLIQQSSQKCLNLLHSFYYEKLPMKEIARVFGYGSEHSVTVQKYKCIEKLREQVKQKAIGYEDFTE